MAHRKYPQIRVLALASMIGTTLSCGGPHTPDTAQLNDDEPLQQASTASLIVPSVSTLLLANQGQNFLAQAGTHPELAEAPWAQHLLNKGNVGDFAFRSLAIRCRNADAGVITSVTLCPLMEGNLRDQGVLDPAVLGGLLSMVPSRQFPNAVTLSASHFGTHEARASGTLNLTSALKPLLQRILGTPPYRPVPTTFSAVDSNLLQVESRADTHDISPSASEEGWKGPILVEKTDADTLKIKRIDVLDIQFCLKIGFNFNYPRETSATRIRSLTRSDSVLCRSAHDSELREKSAYYRDNANARSNFAFIEVGEVVLRRSELTDNDERTFFQAIMATYAANPAYTGGYGVAADAYRLPRRSSNSVAARIFFSIETAEAVLDGLGLSYPRTTEDAARVMGLQAELNWSETGSNQASRCVLVPRAQRGKRPVESATKIGAVLNLSSSFPERDIYTDPEKFDAWAKFMVRPEDFTFAFRIQTPSDTPAPAVEFQTSLARGGTVGILRSGVRSWFFTGLWPGRSLQIPLRMGFPVNGTASASTYHVDFGFGTAFERTGELTYSVVDSRWNHHQQDRRLELQISRGYQGEDRCVGGQAWKGSSFPTITPR